MSVTGKLQELDYDSCCLGAVQWILLAAKTVGLVWLIGYLFYNSVYAFLLFIPIFPFMYRYEKKRRIRKRKQKLTLAFKDAIVALYSFVSAGSTLERAFEQTAKSLLLSCQPEDDIVREFEQICRKLQMNVTIESCMEDFAYRSGLEDIENFAQVIALAKRSGGSMTAVIKNSVDTIKIKIESENEIRTMISAQSNEFKIMVVVPAAVLLYMRIFSPGFMDVLYGNAAGVLLMTVCLAVYAFCIFWGFRILDIRCV